MLKCRYLLVGNTSQYYALQFREFDMSNFCKWNVQLSHLHHILQRLTHLMFLALSCKLLIQYHFLDAPLIDILENIHQFPTYKSKHIIPKTLMRYGKMSRQFHIRILDTMLKFMYYLGDQLKLRFWLWKLIQNVRVENCQPYFVELEGMLRELVGTVGQGNLFLHRGEYFALSN